MRKPAFLSTEPTEILAHMDHALDLAGRPTTSLGAGRLLWQFAKEQNRKLKAARGQSHHRKGKAHAHQARVQAILRPGP